MNRKHTGNKNASGCDKYVHYCFLTGSSLTAGSLLGSFAGNTGLSGTGSLGTLLAAGKGENLSGEDWSNMVQILRLQMMMNMGKDTGTLI